MVSTQETKGESLQIPHKVKLDHHFGRQITLQPSDGGDGLSSIGSQHRSYTSGTPLAGRRSDRVQHQMEESRPLQSNDRKTRP